ncbi:adenylosuccinate synthetase, partial [Chloroflexota bacterium]
VVDLEKCQPIYEELLGWQCSTTHVRKYDDLPKEARQYVSRLSELAACPINLVCIGPEREQTIEANPVI